MTLSDVTKDMSKNEAHFLAGSEDGVIVAVNSFHRAELPVVARSRGLWVDPSFRNRGLGKQMLLETSRLARAMGSTMLWSYPRQTSLSVYESVGFHRVSGWCDGEFGPNCYVLKWLSDDQPE